MSHIVGLLEIIRIYGGLKKPRKSEGPIVPHEEPFDDQDPMEEPRNEIVPPEIDPPAHPFQQEKEPPLTPEEELDPSNNPMKAEYKESLWTITH